MPTTLTGHVERVTYENEETSFRVIKLGRIEGPTGGRQRTIAVVGTFQAVGPGAPVRITGDFFEDPRYGEQFRASSLVVLSPDTLEGLEKYLGSGVISGIGPGYSKRIVRKFGMDTLTILDNQPDRLSEVSGLGERRVAEIKEAWSKRRASSNVMVLLQTHGASPSLAARIVERYGDRAAGVIQRSPYRLALDVHGVGFKTADKMARSLGISGDHPERAQAGVMHVLGLFSEQGGHVFAPRATLAEQSAHMLEIDVSHVEAAIDALWASGRLVVEGEPVYSARLHAAEVKVVEQLSRLTAHETRSLSVDRALLEFKERSRIELAPNQRAAVQAAADNQVFIVTGGPGVGKTTIVRAIVQVFERARLATRLAAPTGRAAKRMSEATGRDACTLHRLLEFDPKSFSFQRGRERPLGAGAVIVDEASMIDVPLAAALLEALPDKCRLVIVGDADQLPSVGPGAFLRNVLESRCITAVHLDRIFRQAAHSTIIQNAHRILRGEPPTGDDREKSDADFFIIPCEQAEQAAELVRRLVVERIPRRFGFDPPQIQVLTPMHRGRAGTSQLNAMLQEALNPNGPWLDSQDQKLRVGDKVLQTRNDYERDVFNGDLGTIASLNSDKKSLIVDFSGRSVEYDSRDLDMLTLAYATSIHKSQGSEYPAVVVPLLTSHYVMLSRNLLYTAVTRAKQLCVLITSRRALGIALGETRREQRLTRLCERLQEALARS